MCARAQQKQQNTLRSVSLQAQFYNLGGAELRGHRDVALGRRPIGRSRTQSRTQCPKPQRRQTPEFGDECPVVDDIDGGVDLRQQNGHEGARAHHVSSGVAQDGPPHHERHRVADEGRGRDDDDAQGQAAADSLRRSSLLLRHSVGDVTVTYLPHDGDVEEEHQDERREIRDDLVPVVSVQGVKGGHDARAQRRDVPSATWQDGGVEEDAEHGGDSHDLRHHAPHKDGDAQRHHSAARQHERGVDWSVDCQESEERKRKKGRTYLWWR